MALTDDEPLACFAKLNPETDPAPELSVVTANGPIGLLMPASVPSAKTWYCVFGVKWDRFTVTLQTLGFEVGLYEIDTVGEIGTIVPPCAPKLTHAPWFANCVPFEPWSFIQPLAHVAANLRTFWTKQSYGQPVAALAGRNSASS